MATFQQNSIKPSRPLHTLASKSQLLGKATSTLLVYFLDRCLALDIKRAGICYNSLHLKGQHHLQGPKQWYNCLAVGHSCKNKLGCSRCGGEHNSASCKGMGDLTHSCQRCLNKDRKNATEIDFADPKYDHSTFSNACPVHAKELASLSKDETNTTTSS